MTYIHTEWMDNAFTLSTIPPRYAGTGHWWASSFEYCANKLQPTEATAEYCSIFWDWNKLPNKQTKTNLIISQLCSHVAGRIIHLSSLREACYEKGQPGACTSRILPMPKTSNFAGENNISFLWRRQLVPWAQNSNSCQPVLSCWSK